MDCFISVGNWKSRMHPNCDMQIVKSVMACCQEKNIGMLKCPGSDFVFWFVCVNKQLCDRRKIKLLGSSVYWSLTNQALLSTFQIFFFVCHFLGCTKFSSCQLVIFRQFFCIWCANLPNSPGGKHPPQFRHGLWGSSFEWVDFTWFVLVVHEISLLMSFVSLVFLFEQICLFRLPPWFRTDLCACSHVVDCWMAWSSSCACKMDAGCYVLFLYQNMTVTTGVIESPILGGSNNANVYNVW